MRALLIHNLQSGQRERREEIAQAVSHLTGAGWQMEVVSSDSVQQLEEATRAAVAAEMEVVIVAGGDGTLNVAAQALAQRRTALGVLPIGTGNIWARAMGIPLDLPGATRVLLSGQVAQVDLGRADGRYFLFVAGIGFDGSVMRDLNPRTKRRLGRLAYVVAAVVEAVKLRGVEATISVDGRILRQRVLMVVANNVRMYGGVLPLAPNAYVDDGLLDIWVFRGQGMLSAAAHAINILMGRHSRNPGAQFYQSSSISVDARNSLPIQLDGDYFGTTPTSVKVEPKALRALIPSGPNPLFCRPIEEVLSSRP